jgi:hypothetical protein
MGKNVKSETILNEMQEIRNFINEGRKTYSLGQDKGKFSQVFSSLDVIEDAELAIAAFGRSEFDKEVGLGYLLIYGVLQAAIVQQDAVKHLCDALGILWDRRNCQSLTEIREIRNASIGHPSKQDHITPTAYNHITRISMSIHGFDLLTFKADGSYESRRVELSKLIEEQRQAIVNILLKVTNELKNERESHKARFRMHKMVQFFPSELSFYCQKVGESIVNGNNVGLTGIAFIKRSFVGFRDAAIERNPSMIVQLDLEYTTINHAIAYLEHYLNTSDGDLKTARIFIEHLNSRIVEICKWAKEIDGDYATRR